MAEYATRLGKRLPLLIAVLTGMTLFLFQNRTNGFDDRHHGNLSSHGMALSENLSVSERPFFMFTRRSLLDDGQVVYEAYNRFPVTPFLLIHLATQPFAPNLAQQIRAARLTMNLFFLLAMIVGFLLARELLGNEWQALVAALLSFSSHFVLYYSDMVFNDVPALFGFLVALLIVAKSQNARLPTRALVLAPLIPISMGWQPYAVFGSWLLVDLFTNIRRRSSRPAAILRLPSLVVMLSAIAFGVLIAGFQLLNEQRVTGAAPQDMDTLRSALWRIGLGTSQSYAQYSHALSWTSFSLQQVSRIASMIVPFAGILTAVLRLRYVIAAGLCIVAAAAALSIRSSNQRQSLAKYVREKHRILLVLILSGLLWSIPMRHFVVFHDFQAIFYIGVPIALFVCLLRAWSAVSRMIVGVIVGLFVLCVYAVNEHKAADAPRLNAVTAQFQNIRGHLGPGSKVLLDVDDSALKIGSHSTDFYTAGVYLTSAQSADYVISANSDYPGVKLTANRTVNLYAVKDR